MISQSTTDYPEVGVVIPTHNRRTMLYAAVTSVRKQDYPGRMDVVVCFDGSTPDEDMKHELDRRGARWVCNARNRGLPGARNAGALALNTELIAYCDDDDMWYPAKLRKQVEAWARDPGAVMYTSGITVLDPDGQPHERLAGAARVTHPQLLRDRIAPLHSSTFLFRRAALLDWGLFDETAPRGHNEDWDILLRASQRGPIGVVDEPLVAAPWGASSYFTYDFQSKVQSFDWMLERHPDLAADSVARARVLGQKAFWLACGEDPTARTVAKEAMRADPRQIRGYLALLATTPILSGPRVLSWMHRIGRGV